MIALEVRWWLGQGFQRQAPCEVASAFLIFGDSVHIYADGNEDFDDRIGERWRAEEESSCAQ